MFELYNRPASLFERIGDIVGSLFDSVGDWIEAFYESSLRVSVTEATASGIIAGFMLSVITASDSSRGLDVKLFLLNLITTLNCYLILTLIMHSLLQFNALYRHFSWFLISLGGSVISWVAISIPMAVSRWGVHAVVEEPIALFMIVFSSLFFVLLFNFVTLPITAAIHFMGAIVRGMRL